MQAFLKRGYIYVIKVHLDETNFLTNNGKALDNLTRLSRERNPDGMNDSPAYYVNLIYMDQDIVGNRIIIFYFPVCWWEWVENGCLGKILWFLFLNRF